MVIIGRHGYNLQSTSAKLRGTNCSLSQAGYLDDTRLQCENSALPFPLFSKVQVSVVPRCSGGVGPARPANPVPTSLGSPQLQENTTCNLDWSRRYSQPS